MRQIKQVINSNGTYYGMAGPARGLHFTQLEGDPEILQRLGHSFHLIFSEIFSAVSDHIKISLDYE